MNRKLVGLAIIGAMLLIAPIGRAAEEKPDATVKMTGKALSAGVGYSWGSGTLTYQGKEYPFSISGLSAGSRGYGCRWRRWYDDEEPKRRYHERCRDNKRSVVQTRS